MAGTARLLSLALGCATHLIGCVSTDHTSGLPCDDDDQCGGGERCVGGYCGGEPALTVAPSSSTTAGNETTEDDDSSSIEGSSSTAAGECGAYGQPDCPPCDPLLPACGPGLVCYLDLLGSASCVAPTAASPVGAACSAFFVAECLPGSYCGLGDQASCDAFCCVELCDLSASTCPAGYECTMLAIEPADGLEHLGECRLPMN